MELPNFSQVASLQRNGLFNRVCNFFSYGITRAYSSKRAAFSFIDGINFYVVATFISCDELNHKYFSTKCNEGVPQDKLQLRHFFFKAKNAHRSPVNFRVNSRQETNF